MQHLMGTVHEGIEADIDRYQALILILILILILMASPLSPSDPRKRGTIQYNRRCLNVGITPKALLFYSFLHLVHPARWCLIQITATAKKQI